MVAGSYDVQKKRLGYVYWNRRQRVTVTGGELELAFDLQPTASVEGVVVQD